MFLNPQGIFLSPEPCSAQSWVVLPLANNEMNWVLTNEQFTQSIHLKQRFLSAEAVLRDKSQSLPLLYGDSIVLSLVRQEQVFHSPYANGQACAELCVGFSFKPASPGYQRTMSEPSGVFQYCLTEKTCWDSLEILANSLCEIAPVSTESL